MFTALLGSIISQLDSRSRKLSARAERAYGINLRDALVRAPSFVRGSWQQSVSTFERSFRYLRRGGPAVMLVPGMFCTPSTMNRLGAALELMGADVYIPRRFPLSYGVLGNTTRIQISAEILLSDLEELRASQDVLHVSIVGHSLGGLISLSARKLAMERNSHIPTIDALVTMATPFRGAPAGAALRRIFPAGHDLGTNANVLRGLRSEWPTVTRTLVAGYDAIVPEWSQRISNVPSVLLTDFQHMDFVVGTPAKIQRTAALIAEVIPSLHNLAG